MKRRDIYIICAALILAAGLLIVQRLNTSGAAFAKISKDGSQYALIPIGKDKEITIDLDGKKNVIKIEGEYAFMEEASCPDHLCQRQGKINRPGQTVVCLPNKVVIEIVGENNGEDGELDGIVK